MLQWRNKNVNSFLGTNHLFCCCIYGKIFPGCSITNTLGGENISRIAEVRRAHEMTQEQLAQAAGIHRVTIARYESGATSPTVRSLEKLAAAMGVPVSDLVDRKGA